MPDDDYGVAETAMLRNMRRERKSTVSKSDIKKMDIRKLVIGMETRAKGPLNATPWIWYVEQIIRVLKRMNDIE